jgi:DNA-directed RNA polymerase specialized sigma24 family protein
MLRPVKDQGTRTGNVSDVAAEALERAQKTAEKIRRLEPRLENLRRELHAAILDARDEGASIALIAAAAGVSKQRVDQIVKRGRR